jgi:hypothetical protein
MQTQTHTHTSCLTLAVSLLGAFTAYNENSACKETTNYKLARTLMIGTFILFAAFVVIKAVRAVTLFCRGDPRRRAQANDDDAKDAEERVFALNEPLDGDDGGGGGGVAAATPLLPARLLAPRLNANAIAEYDDVSYARLFGKQAKGWRKVGAITLGASTFSLHSLFLRVCAWPCQAGAITLGTVNHYVPVLSNTHSLFYSFFLFLPFL